MLNIVLTAEGGSLSPGNPQVFVTDKDFSELLGNKELAKDVWEFFGKNVCVGRLGTEIQGVFVENDTVPSVSLPEERKELFGFYDKL